jgi:hypothetical protein
LCLSNHWCHFFEEREKQYAESKRKGVVGSTGKKFQEWLNQGKQIQKQERKPASQKGFYQQFSFDSYLCNA